MATPDRLAQLRPIYWNPERSPRVNCAVCSAPVDGWAVCLSCKTHRDAGVPLADIVAPITWAVEGGQAMRDLYSYKDPALALSAREAVADRLKLMLRESLTRHLRCIRGHGPAITGLAMVPSSSGRSGPHPLGDMLSIFKGSVVQVPVRYVGPVGLGRADRRVFAPDRFEADPIAGGRHVLLLEDTWVTGHRTQSVASALKRAGASRVSVVVLGRELKPSWGPTKEYMDTHPRTPWNPTVCPVTGLAHP